MIVKNSLFEGGKGKYVIENQRTESLPWTYVENCRFVGNNSIALYN